VYSPQPLALETFPVRPERVPWSPNPTIEAVKRVSNADVYDKNFNIIRNDIHIGKLDWVQMGIGPEGTGKTWVGIRDCCEIDPQFLKQSKDLPQVPFTLEEVKQFLELWRTNDFYKRRGVGLLIDEGAALLSSRSASSKESKELVTLLTQIRAEFGFFIHINYQSQRLADSWLRNDRAKSIAKTYFSFDYKDQVHRVGNVHYYNKKQMEKIKKDQSSGQITWPAFPSFRSTFEPGDKRFVDIYNLVNEKKYAHYTSAETEKKTKNARAGRVNDLLGRLQLAKIDADVDKQRKIRAQLKELGYE
jgi:hypothetical protein